MIRLINRIAAALTLVALSAVAVPVQAGTLPPAPAPSASFDSGMLHVDRYGSGPQSLILIPGLGSGPWSWYGTIAHFSPKYTIYAVTLAGFDGRPPSTEIPLISSFSSDFWQMLSSHDIKMPVVIGHSLGGTLAFLLAEQHPELLRAVVAADGMPIFPLLASKTDAEREAIANQAAGMYGALSPAGALSYETNFMQTIGTNQPDLVAPTAKLEAASDPKTVAAWLQTDLASDLRPELPAISIPVLEIMPYDPSMGAKAGFTQEQGVAFYRSLLIGTQHATVVAIGPSKHFVMLDQPDKFYAAVQQFLDGLGG
ncbi:MAG TPA: alpha/beta hydrolase [Candidatus Tumulicola sp.]